MLCELCWQVEKRHEGYTQASEGVGWFETHSSVFATFQKHNLHQQKPLKHIKKVKIICQNVEKIE